MAGKLKSGTIIAHLIVNDASKALDFYKNAFGAEILGVHKTPDGKVMHAELSFGGARLMLADEFPGIGSGSAKTLGGSPVVLNLYVPEDVDSLFNQAVGAGATVVMPLADQFWGDRYGQITDPFGHRWALGQHVEDVAPDEMERRAKEAFAAMAALPAVERGRPNGRLTKSRRQGGFFPVRFTGGFMSTSQATHHDAELILKIYELRREQVMRDARNFVFGFTATSVDDLLKVTQAFGSQENAYFRQVYGYWEMVAALVVHGTLNALLVYDTCPEMYFTYAKIQPFVEEFRQK